MEHFRDLQPPISQSFEILRVIHLRKVSLENYTLPEVLLPTDRSQTIAHEGCQAALWGGFQVPASSHMGW